MSRTQRTAVFVLVLLFPCTSAFSADPPFPTSAAEFFVPAVQGITAADFCGDLQSGNTCLVFDPGGAINVNVQTKNDHLMRDAVGNIYLLGTEQEIGPCQDGALREIFILRMTPVAGQGEIFGSFREKCFQDYSSRVRFLGIGLAGC